MKMRRLIRLKYGLDEVGFLGARVEEDDREPFWTLRVESPSLVDPFRDHLNDGSSLTLQMVTGDGARLRGEAYVSRISDGVDAATVLVFAGAGPLRQV